VSDAAAVGRRLNYQPTAYQIKWPSLAKEQTTAWDWGVEGGGEWP